MLVRILQVAIMLAAFSLLALAAFDYFCEPRGCAVTVAEPNRIIEVGPPGHDALVRFDLDNAGRRPVRVIGLAQC
jgi:hypothetical protein